MAFGSAAYGAFPYGGHIGGFDSSVGTNTTDYKLRGAAPSAIKKERGTVTKQSPRAVGVGRR